MKSCKELLGLASWTGEVAKKGCSSTLHVLIFASSF
jgi:hypothetical protein